MGQALQDRQNVLLVEDELLISEMVADALEDQGFCVHMVRSAADALRYIQSGLRVDALFTDVNLPGAMDGAELAKRVRDLRPDMPILYASGRWAPDTNSALVPRSVFLRKPYSPNYAGNVLARLLGVRRCEEVGA